MTRDELLQNDGRDGRKAYVAVNGTVYDFTESQMWQNGDHQGVHQAGCDLTEELKGAPHVRAVIERFPVVGKLEEKEHAVKKKRGNLNFFILIGAAVLLVAFFAYVI